MNSHPHTGSCCHCPCHRTQIAKQPPVIDPFAVNRRDFLSGMGALTVGGILLANAKSAGAAEYAPQRLPLIRQPVKVQPVLTYEIPKRQEATSWRSWGGIQKEEDAIAEKSWITGELEKLKQQAGFPLEFLPVAMVKTAEEAAAAAKGDFDVMLIYGAGGGGNLLDNCTLLRRTATAFTSTGIPADFAVLCQLIAPCRPSMRFLSISSRLSPSLPSPRRLPFASWLQMVVSSFSCSGIPTGDFNPIYNVPMLGTHKSCHPTGISPSIPPHRLPQPRPRMHIERSLEKLKTLYYEPFILEIRLDGRSIEQPDCRIFNSWR